ncbi:MAG: hypothetical protein ACI4SR_05390 [Faecalibacillus sp.]
MDYIYKDKGGIKHVGEIGYLRITPFYEFEVKVNGQMMTCYLDHLLSEWEICFPDYEIMIKLAHPADIFWNSEAIYEKIKDQDISLQIAYAIKEVYSEKDYSEDVL